MHLSGQAGGPRVGPVRTGREEGRCYLTFPGVPPPSLGGPGWERAPLLQLREVWRLSCWPSCFPPLAPLTLTAPAQTPLPSVFSIASFHNAHPCPSLEVNFKFSQQVFCTSAFIAKCCRCKPPLSPKTVFGILCALFLVVVTKDCLVTLPRPGLLQPHLQLGQPWAGWGVRVHFLC